jgi:undecaprenyl-diphosphatase
MVRKTLDGWSSLPSDHAALAFALATVIFLLHRRWGLWALLHAGVIVCLPRAYLSLHYPSDLLAGALVGVASVLFVLRFANRNVVTRLMLQLEDSHPATFYSGSMLFLLQMIQMFDPLRRIYKVMRPALTQMLR